MGRGEKGDREGESVYRQESTHTVAFSATCVCVCVCVKLTDTESR